MNTPTTTADTPRSGTPLRRLWRSGLTGAAVAVATNLVVFAVAHVADISFSVRFSSGSNPTDITAFQVVAATLIGFLVGLAVTSAVETWTGRDVRIMQAVGAVVAVASIAMPLSLDADTATKLTLSAMHIIAGAIFVGTLQIVRHR